MKKNSSIGVLGGLFCIKVALLLMLMATPQLTLAQSTTPITLNDKSISVEQVFRIIQSKYGYSFVVMADDVNLKKDVAVELQDGSIEELLDILFKGDNVDYYVTGKSISVVKKEQTKATAAHTITGTIVDTENKPIIGATIMVLQERQGSVTGIDGDFSIKVNIAEPILLIESIGYESQTIRLSQSQSSVDITLKSSNHKIDAVVVTALGITRKEKSLGYAMSSVGGDVLENTAGANWLGGLDGKISGLTMDKSSAGPGGSMRVTLRGESSLSYNNNSALFVVDGVPINGSMVGNSSEGTYGSDDAPIDYGNGSSDINPDDVESVSVLKGASATALYGSRAANGAIIITTKSGRKQSGLGVSFSTGVVFEKASYWPSFQTEYGAGDYRKSTLGSHMSNGITPDEYSFYNVPSSLSYNGEDIKTFHSRYQFGEKITGQQRYMYDSYNRETGEYTLTDYGVRDWYKGFYETGVTKTNSLSIESNNGKGSQMRLSIKDSRTDWIVPNTGFETQAFSVSANNKRNKYIQTEMKVTYYRKDSDNLPVSGYSNSSPLKSLLWQPVSASVGDLYNEWADGSIVKYNSGADRTFKLVDGSLDNPYFIAYEHLNTMDRDRVYGNINITGNIIPEKLSLKLRSGVDLSNDFRTQQKPQYSHSYADGMYREQTVRSLEVNTDFLLQYNGKIGKDITLAASFGGNNMLQSYSNVSLFAAQLEEPNIFILQNVKGTLDFKSYRQEKSINSLYGFANLAWRDMIFLDVTGRNDWSSTLAPGNNSYFYPSVSTSILLDKLFDIQSKAEWIDMVKYRASWANVGNDTDPYNLLATYNNSSNFTGSYYLPSETVNYNIRPENVESWETGVEVSLLKRRIALDATYYFTETTDQIINVPSDWATGAESMFINAGCVRNQGIELSASFNPIRTKDWDWNINVNWSKNKNELVELADGISVWQLNAKNTCGGRVFIYAYPGGELGRIYGTGYERAPKGAYYIDANGKKVLCEGEVVVNESTGNPVLSTELQDLGSIYPDWRGGLNTSLRYKNLTLNMSFTGQVGGNAYSLTNAILGYMGKTTASTYGRYDGLTHPGVNLSADGTYSKNTTVTTDVVEYYNLYACNRNNIETNTFDTSYLKLKELRLNYSLPKSICERTRVFQSASVGFFATNLFCITDWPQFDPEVASMSGSSLFRGVETGSYPLTRSYGFDIKLSF